MIQTVFSALYRHFSRRRRRLFAGTLAVIVLSLAVGQRVRIEEDVTALLPDDGSAVAEHFSLLRATPAARGVVITLRAEAGTDQAALLSSADRLAAQLGPPGFSRAVAGTGGVGPEAIRRLSSALPNLFTARDAEQVAAALTPETIAARLEAARERLLSPGGLAFTTAVREDPLDLGAVALGKLRALGLVPGARLVDGHFTSADGRSALVVAETPVPLTDSTGSRALLAQFDATARATLSPGIAAEVVSGHRYTVANADAVRGDLARVLGLSSIAVLAIYLVFLRSRWALFVFLVPSTVLLITTALAVGIWGKLFAVTLGFGAVLLGLADEYAMHLYFALRLGEAPAEEVVGNVARPVLFGGLATIAAFGVMLFSSLPGQRQLAVYAVSGIAISLLVSLVVLPHLVPPANPGAPEPKPVVKPRPGQRRWVLGAWAIVLLWSAWQAAGLRFNGDLRAVNYVPEELRRAETRLRDTWGDPRGRAIALVEGGSLEDALESNDRLWAWLSDKVPAADITSLAPLLPSKSSQRANRERWRAFWASDAGAGVADLLGTHGRAAGFSADAFAPFLARISGDLPPLTIETLRGAGLGDAVGALVVEVGGATRVLTLLPDTPSTAALFGAPASPPPGVRFVSPSGFNRSASDAIAGEFSRYLALTSILVIVLVAAVFRRPRQGLLALVPAFTGMIIMCGGMGFLGLEFNLFNIVATVLVIGLCVDYGIFMVSALDSNGTRAGDRAVLVSGLTTLAGFGSLVLARHPSLHSIGLTVLLGIGAAIPAALLVVPALWARER